MLPDHFTDRISLLELVQSRFPGGTGVEIGVASGCFTKQILATWKSVGVLHCVDLWDFQPEDYSDPCNLPKEVQEERYNQFLHDMAGDKRVRTIRNWSHVAAVQFEPRSVDFIYLDANHSKDACLKDLNAWWPKLKPGGILAGHDYERGNRNGMGVFDAVNEFFGGLGIPIRQTTQEYCRESGVYGACWEGFSFVVEK